jgi:hypothetical protein
MITVDTKVQFEKDGKVFTGNVVIMQGSFLYVQDDNSKEKILVNKNDCTTI